jgi:DNA-binding HxlR family transcriptional regulator
MAKTRKPSSSPLRGSATDEHITALLDLLGHRWTLRILWELHDELLTFRALQSRCGNPSPSVLNARLRELGENDLVDLSDGEGYCLTGFGTELATHLLPLNRWSDRWASALSGEYSAEFKAGGTKTRR